MAVSLLYNLLLVSASVTIASVTIDWSLSSCLRQSASFFFISMNQLICKLHKGILFCPNLLAYKMEISTKIFFNSNTYESTNICYVFSILPTRSCYTNTLVSFFYPHWGTLQFRGQNYISQNPTILSSYLESVKCHGSPLWPEYLKICLLKNPWLSLDNHWVDRA